MLDTAHRWFLDTHVCTPLARLWGRKAPHDTLDGSRHIAEYVEEKSGALNQGHKSEHIGLSLLARQKCNEYMYRC